jgi:hypothetical protein
MLIKILKGETLYSAQGTHICDDKGFALIAEEDTDCNVQDRIDIVMQILKEQRLGRGLNEDGSPKVETEEKIETLEISEENIQSEQE